jgi:Ca2+-binding RTX toxin-like protein
MSLGSSRASRARVLSIAGVLMAFGLGVTPTASAQSGISATFTPAAGLLSIGGNNAANEIVISRDAAGQLLVNGGSVAIAGGTPTVANTSLIQVFGEGGSDTISLDETNGALPAADMFGGNGNDTLTGGSGADRLFGEDGNDTLLGRGGTDQLFGGDGNDVLTGGDADDQVFGENGKDRMIWNPGDDTDLNEGGDGDDTVEVNGGNGSETFAIAANGARVRFDRLTPAPFSIDIGSTESLIVNGNGGDDIISAGTGLNGLIAITMDGGAGNDTLNGGDGQDLMIGGDGDDTIDGNRGDDTARMSAGDDTFIWDPGDGRDVVEGEAGHDTLRFNGAAAIENIDISARGNGRVRFFRDVASITMDLNEVEVVAFNALGGADTIVVNDLERTDTVEIDLSLEAQVGGGAGDGQADKVVVHGTNHADTVEVVGSGNSYTVTGLSALVRVTGSEATDQLEVLAERGDDTVSAATLPANIVKLTLDGGPGDDVLFGSDGADVILGGSGADAIDGDRGDDVAFMGSGNDVFTWDPGEGSDVVEGQEGQDTLLFNGAGASENVDISANGPRARFFRDVASITMDLNEVERIAFNALGGADSIVVNDLDGTDVRKVTLDLAAPAGNGTGDGQADTVIVNGTDARDSVDINRPAGLVVRGLRAEVDILGSEGAFDKLQVNTLGGDDKVNASDVTAGALLQLTVDGGAGDDRLIGSEGADTLLGNAGDDTLDGGPGDDVLDGGDGTDVGRNGEVLLNLP